MSPVATIDLEVMRVLHDAFRRDLRLFVREAPGFHGADPRRRKAIRRRWRLFTGQLRQHHTLEDVHLWPVLRSRFADRPDVLAVLDAMEAEHGLLAPGFAAVDVALAGSSPAALVEAVQQLNGVVHRHLAHEERAALPLVAERVRAAEWDAMGQQARRDVGMIGAMDFFPWLLDGVEPHRAREVLTRMIPAPVRFLHRVHWSPRWRRRYSVLADASA